MVHLARIDLRTLKNSIFACPVDLADPDGDHDVYSHAHESIGRYADDATFCDHLCDRPVT